MKKILLPIVAVCACAAPAFADEVYGTTPETAKPFPSGPMGWMIMGDAPAEAWFTLSHEETNPALLSLTNLESITVYFKNGMEAFRWNGSYVLSPKEEYLLKIEYKSSMSPMYMPMGPGGKTVNPLPDKYAAPGSAEYCPAPRMNEYGGTVEHTIQPGTTYWVLTDLHSTQLSISKNRYNASATGDLNLVTGVQVYHIDGTGAYSDNSGVMFGGPYVKKGRNVVGITYSGSATEPLQIQVASDPNIFTCDYKFENAPAMTVGDKFTYHDGYYTVDYPFIVPEDGDYTITNHGAYGTMLYVGTVSTRDEEVMPGVTVTRYDSNFDDARMAAVNSNDAKIVISAKKGEIYFVRSDAFESLGATDFESMPYLLIEKGKQSGIADVAAGADALNVSVNGGVLTVESALLASGAEVAVYDMLGRKVASTTAAAGAVNIEMDLDAAAGVYVVAVSGKNGSESAKIAIK